MSEILKDYRVQFVVNINMAYLIQQRWRESTDHTPNHPHIRSAIRALKCLYEDVPVSSDTAVFQRIKIEFTIAKSYLQLAASHSQFYMHTKALSCARKALEYLSLLLNNIQNLLQEQSMSLDLSFDHNSDNSRVIAESPDTKTRFLAFVQPVKRSIDSIESLLKNLDASNLDFPFRDRFDDLSKLLAVDVVRKIDTAWLDDISITNFMHVEWVNFAVISSSIKFDEIYSDSFLAFTVMLSSVVLFAISTENRFLLLDSLNAAKGTSFRIKPVFEKTHQQRVRKMKRFVFSELVHAKSIHFVQHFLKDNHLQTHLVNSYRKNYEYSKTLEEIVS